MLASDKIVWWTILLLILAGILAVASVFLIFRAEHSTKVFPHDDTRAIGKYLTRWIGPGRRVVVSTGDMSWADDPNLMGLLEQKAEARELTVLLPAEIERSDRLKARGATIIAYGNAGPVRSAFTITNFGSPGARLAIGWPSGDYHIIHEYTATDDHPTYHLAQQFVNLATEHANARD